MSLQNENHGRDFADALEEMGAEGDFEQDLTLGSTAPADDEESNPVFDASPTHEKNALDDEFGLDDVVTADNVKSTIRKREDRIRKLASDVRENLASDAQLDALCRAGLGKPLESFSNRKAAEQAIRRAGGARLLTELEFLSKNPQFPVSQGNSQMIYKHVAMIQGKDPRNATVDDLEAAYHDLQAARVFEPSPIQQAQAAQTEAAVDELLRHRGQRKATALGDDI